MRFVSSPEPGVVELSFTWLPTFLGLNPQLKDEVEKLLGPKYVGQDMCDEVLDRMHRDVIEFLVKKYPQLPGLFHYLDAIKHVRDTTT